jgi:uncharacterized protein (TIGR01777 family)
MAGPIVIAGGSGFLGVSLATHLASSGKAVVLVSRHPPKVAGPWRYVSWDGRTLGDWRRELDGAGGLVNLAGRSVDCVKTPDHQDEILRSRVEATRLLGQAVRAVACPPPVWVQMSTAHIYGDPPEAVCREDSPFGYGLAPFVGRAWEEEFRVAALPSQRQVILRTSFVLGRDRGAGGGALPRLRWLARLGLGGRIGAGTQGMSWIHGGPESPVRARSHGSRHAGRVHRVGPKPGRATRLHAHPAPRRRHADRAAGLFLDGPPGRTLVVAHGSGARAIRSICGVTALARRTV